MWLHSCLAMGNSGPALADVNGGVLEYRETYIGDGVVDVDGRSSAGEYLISA